MALRAKATPAPARPCRADENRRDRGGDRDEQGPAPARMGICRPDDGALLYAGHGTGQRPCPGLRRRGRGGAPAPGVCPPALILPRAGDVWELVLPAVFKTVCGALLRRPGWVRFPSIPANFLRNDSQDDAMKERASAPMVKG